MSNSILAGTDTEHWTELHGDVSFTFDGDKLRHIWISAASTEDPHIRLHGQFRTHPPDKGHWLLRHK